jgi:hypothetical protein
MIYLCAGSGRGQRFESAHACHLIQRRLSERRKILKEEVRVNDRISLSAVNQAATPPQKESKSCY